MNSDRNLFGSFSATSYRLRIICSFEAILVSFSLAAAPYFEHRLPEVFAGYPASLTTVPVAFPDGLSPAAWAAGAPLLLLTTFLDVRPEPAAVNGRGVLEPDAARVPPR